LLELTLSLVITSVIAAAIVGMMAAVSAGVDSRRDARSTMVTANAAATRLGAYIAPARAILEQSDTTLVIWLHDDRAGETVHGTEIRWFMLDNATGALEVHYVTFPEAWTQTMRDLEDKEHLLLTGDWFNILQYYENEGWTTSMPLVEGMDSLMIATNDNDPLAARHVTFTVIFPGSTAPIEVVVPATIGLHEPPTA
jgi:hypothetical protein